MNWTLIYWIECSDDDDEDKLWLSEFIDLHQSVHILEEAEIVKSSCFKQNRDLLDSAGLFPQNNRIMESSKDLL
jgi:hypothetical protein